MGPGGVRPRGGAAGARDFAIRTGHGDGSCRAGQLGFHRPDLGEDGLPMSGAFLNGRRSNGLRANGQPANGLRPSPTRRSALAAYGSLLAGSGLLRGQQLAGEAAGRIAPVGELVNAFEFEAMAQRNMDGAAY